MIGGYPATTKRTPPYVCHIFWLYIKNIPDSGYQIRLTKIVVSFGDNDVDHDDGSGGDDGDFLVLVMVVICRIPS